MAYLHRSQPLIGLLGLLCTGCIAEAPSYVYPWHLPSMTFELFSLQTGVHPYNDILVDPSNPFAAGGVGRETKWDVLDAGAPVASFYAWGTVLVTEPSGEAQFYTSTALREIYALELADPTELWAVRELALAGFQSLLDNFPDSVTYDATGRVAYPLAPQAYDGIVSLGGTVEGGWQKVTLADGSTTVVQVP